MKARLGSLLLLVLAMGFLAFAGMLYYSDVEVRSRFLTARWVAPAQVYAAPMELYRGAPLSADAVESALQRLGYRPGDEAPSQAGEYQRRGEQISIWRRSFRHGADVESDQPLVLQHRGAQLTALRDGSGAARLLDRLEPEHVGSLYPAKGEDRELLRLEDWPDLLRRGLIAVEDQRFARHFGIDPQGLLRAAVKNVLSGGVVEGGSTLTQQLVKNLFLSNERSFVRKVREAFMALLLEWHFDKGAILEAYGNEVYLGQDGNRAIHGFGLASRFWFGKPLAELYDAELALLVGMVKGPSAYNPQRRAEAARARRNLVLRIWFDTGLIDAAALAAGQEAPLGLTAGGAVARSTTAFLDLVRRELRREFPADALAYDGLRIDTHLDARLQSIAESVVRAGVPRLVTRGGEGLQAALVATSPADGRILAIVGSAKPGDRGFNRALDARRPIGSLVKPAVYYAALNRPQDFTLVTRLLDQPFGLEMPNGTRWEPQNFDKEPRGEVFLHEALERSYNLSTARLAIDVGIDAVVRSLRDMGVSTAIPAVPALALGALDLSPLEVARIYTTLAAGGYPSPLRAIAAVSRADGIELLRDELRLQQGLDRRVSYLLHWTLQRALSEGTGRSAANLLPPGQVLAGKTGTSDGQRDAWFAGFGSTLQATVWVGQDDNATMRLTGASGALPLWADFMAKAGASNLDLTPPRGVAMVAIDPDSGQLGGEGCTTLRDIPFLDGSAPDERAPCVQRRSWFERLWQ